MKLIISSIDNGNLKHEEIELPERFLDLSIELSTGPIFQINIDKDEQTFDLREVTFRHLALFPTAANSITVKGL